MAKSDKGANVVSQIFDPVGLLFPHNRGKKKPYPVVGFANDPYGMAQQQAFLGQLRNTGQDYAQGNIAAGANLAAQAGQNAGQAYALGQGAYQQGAMNVANAQAQGRAGISDLLRMSAGREGMLQDAARGSAGWLNAVTGSSMGDIRNRADAGAAGIMAAAARPQSSLAEAQLTGAQMRAQDAALSSAAGLSRGGNAALAQRQALDSLAQQNSANANAFAQLRANEEAAIRNSQIAAATQAGQLGLQGGTAAGQLGVQGANQAGQLLNSGLQQASAVGQQGQATALSANQALGQLGLGTQGHGSTAMGLGISGQTSAGQTQGNIGLQNQATSYGTFADIAGRQQNAELGYGTNAMKAEAAEKGGQQNLLGTIIAGLL